MKRDEVKLQDIRKDFLYKFNNINEENLQNLPKDMKSFKFFIKIKIFELAYIVKKHLGNEFVPNNLNVKYNINRDISVMGKANLDTETIRLSYFLFKKYSLYYIKHVFVHEYAHLVVEKMYPNGLRNGKEIEYHGKEFQYVCSLFGLKGLPEISLNFVTHYDLSEKMIFIS